MTLACEDANSKLVEVVTVGDDHAEDNVGSSLLQRDSGSWTAAKYSSSIF